MGQSIREFDWATTELGPVDNWPLSLRNAVGLILNTKFPMCIIWGTGLVTIHNDAFLPILGRKPSALGRSFREVWHEVWDTIEPFAMKALAGESTFIEDFPIRTNRNGEDETAYFTFSYSPIREFDGRVVGFLDTVVETTAAMESKRAAKLLNEELGHRLKNTLALVQAMASQTLSGAKDQAAVQAFSQRLAALSRAHDVLTRESWAHTRLSVVVEEAARLHNIESRFKTDGPEILLGPKAALSLSLLLHELGTNAVKYGALSVPDGRVSLSWTTSGDELILDWKESGGPPAVRPRREGLGSRLIKAGLSGTANAELSYDVSGFRAVFRAPLDHLTGN